MAAIGVIATMRVVGFAPASFNWIGAFGLAARFGIVGFVSGGAFSVAIGVLYRGERLAQISAVRFGLLGGLITGIFVPLFLQTMNIVSGDGMVPWNLVTDDGLITAVFGGAAAGISLKLAQLAKAGTTVDSEGRLESADSTDRLAADTSFSTFVRAIVAKKRDGSPVE